MSARPVSATPDDINPTAKVLRGVARLTATAAARAEATHWRRLGIPAPDALALAAMQRADGNTTGGDR